MPDSVRLKAVHSESGKQSNHIQFQLLLPPTHQIFIQSDRASVVVFTPRSTVEKVGLNFDERKYGFFLKKVFTLLQHPLQHSFLHYFCFSLKLETIYQGIN